MQLFALLEHLNVTVLDISNTPTTILAEIAMLTSKTTSVVSNICHCRLSRQAGIGLTCKTFGQRQAAGFVILLMFSPFLRCFPLARDNIELADGIFKHPSFGDTLAESAPKLSGITVSPTRRIEGIHLRDDSFGYLRDFSRLLQASLVISISFFLCPCYRWFW